MDIYKNYFIAQTALQPTVYPIATPAAAGVPALAFGGADAAPTLTVSIANAVKGAWYTVYASTDVASGYRSVLCEQAAADGVLSLTIDAADATKFVRVGASADPVPVGAVP